MLEEKKSKMAVSKEELRTWCVQELSKITDCPDDLVDYIFKIEDVDEVEDYFRDFFGESVEDHLDFIENLLTGLKTTSNEELEGKWMRKDKEPEFVSKKQNRKSDKKKGMEKEEKKKPAKFVPLYSKEGEARTSVRLPGRHPCECLAQKHSLINNCTSCGRIVCEQEGEGPCYFCGSLVCTKARLEILARDSKKSAKLMKQLMQQDFSDEVKKLQKTKNMNAKELEAYKKAVEHKNKLLEFDKTSARRTHVIDDEADYFSTNSKWLSTEEKAKLEKKEGELREKRHGSRRNMKVTLDFAGRKVVEDENTCEYEIDSELPGFGYHSKEKAEKSLVDKKSFPDLKLQFKPSKIQNSSSTSKQHVNDGPKVLRIQDKELQEMRDPGMCLSMHQPWASLLVVGIKKVEGRSWYTSHRGRLWIAATVKKPTDQEIDFVEDMYRNMQPNQDLEFPRDYPTGCLLGCVDVVECWSHEEYKENCQDETESESPYVFICDNPKQLLLKVPVKGQHKIWKLDSQVHKEVKLAQKI